MSEQSLEEFIRGRMDLSEQRVADIAQKSGLKGREAELARIMQAAANEYVGARIVELAKADPPPRGQPPHPGYAEWTVHGDGWEGLDRPIGWRRNQRGRLVQVTEWDWLFKRTGKPGNDALLDIYNVLAAWWEDITGKRWAPRFVHDDYGRDVGGETVPVNDAAKLFLGVAQACDNGWTAENCNSVCDRAKQMRKSDAARGRRAQRRLDYARERRAKKKPT